MDSAISHHTFVDFIDPLSSEFVIYGVGLFYLFGFRSVNGIEYVHIASNADSGIVQWAKETLQWCCNVDRLVHISINTEPNTIP